MPQNAFILALCVLAVTSCKVTEKDIIGYYKLNRLPKTKLKINSDKIFEFFKSNRNPHLYPFGHPYIKRKDKFGMTKTSL